ncbi:unnamed protein product [Adineta ricciae]|uniref:Uncharacterized protein n=1 Tax=Adineta ricciae TaxID=249248 RepID=A0A814GUZ5_ADIRI|nr:unnamed protein product [Adineta ricciae]
MHQCTCGQVYDFQQQVIACQKAAHYGFVASDVVQNRNDYTTVSAAYSNTFCPTPGQNDSRLTTMSATHENYGQQGLQNDRFQSNSAPNILSVVADHQYYILNLTNNLVSGNMTKEEWISKVQQATNTIINKVQQMDI